jgi:hypothetical protein
MHKTSKEDRDEMLAEAIWVTHEKYTKFFAKGLKRLIDEHKRLPGRGVARGRGR